VPSTIENEFANDPYISQMIVVGEGRNYLTAMIVRHEGCAATVAELEQHVHAKLARFSPHEQVRRVAVLPEPLSVEHGELTLKLSYCRPVIARRHADTFNALYDREA
jgi:long-chain acyl-CoA synthetase